MKVTFSIFVLLIVLLQVKTKGGFLANFGRKNSGLTEEERIDIIHQKLENLVIQTSDGEEVFSDCYKDAMKQMMNGCKELQSTEQRTRFAIDLTNCHLERVGLRIFDCDKRTPLRKCTKAIGKDDKAFIVYTQLLNHVDDLCFYLSAENFNAKVDESVRIILDVLNLFSSDLSKLVEGGKNVLSIIERIDDNELKVIEKQKDLQNTLVSISKESLERHTKVNKQLDTMNKKTSEIGNEMIDLNKRARKVIDQVDGLSRNLFKQFQLLEKKNEKINKNVEIGISNSETILIEQKEMKNTITNLKKEQKEIHKSTNKIKDTTNKGLEYSRTLVVNLDNLLVKINSAMKDVDKKTTELSVAMDFNKQQQTQIFSTQKAIKKDLSSLGLQIENELNIARNRINELLISTKDNQEKLQQSNEKMFNSFSRLFQDIQGLLNLYNGLLGEWMTIQTVFYYVCILIVIYFVTSAKPIERTRIGLYILFALGGFFEHYAFKTYTGTKSPEEIWSKIKRVRSLFLLLGSCFIFYAYKTYQNYEKMNNNLLKKNNILLNSLLNKESNTKHQKTKIFNTIPKKRFKPKRKPRSIRRNLEQSNGFSKKENLLKNFSNVNYYKNFMKDTYVNRDE